MPVESRRERPAGFTIGHSEGKHWRICFYFESNSGHWKPLNQARLTSRNRNLLILGGDDARRSAGRALLSPTLAECFRFFYLTPGFFAEQARRLQQALIRFPAEGIMPTLVRCPDTHERRAMPREVLPSFCPRGKAVRSN